MIRVSLSFDLRYKSPLQVTLLLLFLWICPSSLLAQSYHFDHGFTIGDSLIEFASAMAVDSHGNVYLTGRYNSDSLDINPGLGIAWAKGGTKEDLFLIKVDSKGNFLWGKTWDINESSLNFHTPNTYHKPPQTTTRLAVDKHGAVYLTDDCYKFVDLVPGLSTFWSAGGLNNSMLVKLDGNGQFIWAKSHENVWINDLTIDNNGDVVIVGDYRGAVNLDSSSNKGSLPKGSKSYHGGSFVAKYTNAGLLKWAHGLLHQSYDKLTTLPNNDIIVTGTYSSFAMLDFDNPQDTTFKSSSTAAKNGWTSTYIVNYDSTGKYRWAKSIKGYYGHVSSTALHANESGQIYFAAEFSGGMDIDPSPKTNLIFAKDYQDAFLTRFDLQGKMHWGHAVASRNGHEFISAIDSDTNGYVYFTGRAAAGADFDFGPGRSQLTAQEEDIPIVKIDSNGNLISLQSLSGAGSDAGLNLHIGDDKIYLSGAFENDLALSPDKTQKVNSRGKHDFFYTNLDFCDKQIIPDSLVLTAIHSNCPVDSIIPPKARNGCSGELVATTTTRFPITKKGRSTVVWNYQDVLGNKYTQTQEVLIEDNIAPVPDTLGLPRIISHCPINQLKVDTPTATDNCIGEVIGTHNASYPIDSSTTIIWAYADADSNTSTQTQDILIMPFDTTYSIQNNTLTANESYSAYQWLDCNDNFKPIAGEINATFTPTTSGLYAVELSDDYCSKVLECQNVSVETGLSEVNTGEKIAFFPNPTQGRLQIEVLKDNTLFKATTMTGKVFYESTLSKGSQTIDLLPVVSKGSYLLHFNNDQTSQQSLLIVE